MDVVWSYIISILIFYFIANGQTYAEKLSTSDDSESSKPPKAKILLISLAGFRKDYITKLNCSNLQELIANGTSASYVQNSINIASIANHYSKVTGLYSESHGIIADTMYDPKLNRVFNSKTRTQSEWWSSVHPIWQEIEKQGQGLSGLCRWPGVYGSMTSTLHCGERVSLKSDIDQALRWLKNGVKLVLFYADDIKNAAIKWGPFSKQAIREVKHFDSMLKYLVEKARVLNVNIVLTSDSGVTDLKWDHVIDLDRCIVPSSYVLIQAQSTLLIYSKQGYTSIEIYKNLTKCPHIRAYLRQNLPSHFRFSHSRRIPPVIAFVALGSVVRSGKPVHRNIDAILNGSLKYQKDMGGSWYHPGYELMRGVFYANGPSFPRGLKYGAINNTDIYAIMCTILGITPHPNNASFNVAKAMLKGTNFQVNPNTSPVSRKQAGVLSKPPKRVRTHSRSKALFGELELRGFLIFVACAAGLMVIVCCVGCIHSMKKNMRGEYKKKAPIYPPLLSTNLTSSSDEE